MREGDAELTRADLAMAAELLAEMTFAVAERAAILAALLTEVAQIEDVEGVA